MGDYAPGMEELLSICLQRISIEETCLTTETEFMEVLKNLEQVRKRWLHAETELKEYKELLVKSDVAKAALEVKLKHARNQLDVEMKRRYKMEADYKYLQRQMQLMCDILVHDSKSSACLNDEQKSLIATFEHRGANVTLPRNNKRLSAIDESSFLSHSDISYDRTDDDMDLDQTVMKPLKSRAREKRRSSMGVAVGTMAGKRGRVRTFSPDLLNRKTLDKDIETIVKTTVVTPDTGQQIHMVVGVTQETPESSVIEERPPSVGREEQTSVWSPGGEAIVEVEVEKPPETPQTEKNSQTAKHVFFSKTVIWPETCSPCGKRIRFGKMVVKCRNCRVITHPECTHKCGSCSNGGGSAQSVTLEGFPLLDHPRVPLLVIECVREIERRGLTERGLYRVPGGEQQVRELRGQFLRGKMPMQLNKVVDIHAICGVLKDFLRRLTEPLVTFRLHRTFMEASEMEELSGTPATKQAIAELPRVNRDTLAFLMIHFHRVMASPQCQMDQKNLSRVFGPTLVGHGHSEPSSSTIMKDTKTQPKVVSRLLSLTDDYWNSVLESNDPQVPIPAVRTNQENKQARFFKPLTSPELNAYRNLASRGTMRGRVSTRPIGRTEASTEPGRRFFPSPS
ncbi:rac GTPase-activating protein 1 isoform 1-T1 [Synchiropus picturatus]